jgi:ribonuclease P protein component
VVRPEQRIRRRADFQDVYQRGVRIQGRYSTVFCLPRSGSDGRLGIAATRRLGGAVVRNRAKRLIREIFRRTNLAHGFDVVVVPRRELLDASLTAVETDYRSAIERFLRRARRPEGAQGV